MKAEPWVLGRVLTLDPILYSLARPAAGRIAAPIRPVEAANRAGISALLRYGCATRSAFVFFCTSRRSDPGPCSSDVQKHLLPTTVAL